MQEQRLVRHCNCFDEGHPADSGVQQHSSILIDDTHRVFQAGVAATDCPAERSLNLARFAVRLGTPCPCTPARSHRSCAPFRTHALLATGPPCRAVRPGPVAPSRSAFPAERIGRAWCNQQPGFPGHNRFEVPIDCCCHYGKARGHRFKSGIADALGVRRDDYNIDRTQDVVHVGAGTEEPHGAWRAHTDHQLLEAASEPAVTYERHGHSRASLCGNPRRREQQVAVTFCQSIHRSHHAK